MVKAAVDLKFSLGNCKKKIIQLCEKEGIVVVLYPIKTANPRGHE